MPKKSRKTSEVIELFEWNELHNLGLVVRNWNEGKKEFEQVHHKVSDAKELLLLSEDIFDGIYDNIDDLVGKIKVLNKKEATLLVNELKNNTSKYIRE